MQQPSAIVKLCAMTKTDILARNCFFNRLKKCVLSSRERPNYPVRRWIKALFLKKNRVKNVFYFSVNDTFLKKSHAAPLIISYF